jgi:hypothetical protein
MKKRFARLAHQRWAAPMHASPVRASRAGLAPGFSVIMRSKSFGTIPVSSLSVRAFLPLTGRCNRPDRVLLVSPHKGSAFWLGTQVVESVPARQAFVTPGVPNPPPLGHLGFSF